MFLRGINVGGIKVKMDALKNALYILKLKKISTVLQSGNVSFESTKTIEELKPIIEKKLSETFEYQAFVQIYTLEDVQDFLKQSPLTQTEGKHDYILLINDKEIFEDIVEQSKELSKEEQVQVGKQVVYWQVSQGHSLDTKFAKLLAKPKYKQNTTVRKLNTLSKIIHS
jgi:uncharacterized protein (DUF1697 family)